MEFFQILNDPETKQKLNDALQAFIDARNLLQEIRDAAILQCSISALVEANRTGVDIDNVLIAAKGYGEWWTRQGMFATPPEPTPPDGS